MTAAAPRKPVRLGDLLVEKGLVSQDQLHIALIEQKKQNVPLGKILIRLGFVTEATMRDTLGELLGEDSVDLKKIVPDSAAIERVPKELARRYRLLPISYDPNNKVLTVAMADTFNVTALDQTAALLGGDLELKPLLAAEAEIETAIDQFYGFELSVDGILH